MAASLPGNAQQSFIAIAKACGTDPNERAAKSWLSSSTHPWLLLIDNADDANIEIEKYFADGEHGLTLIITLNLYSRYMGQSVDVSITSTGSTMMNLMSFF